MKLNDFFSKNDIDENYTYSKGPWFNSLDKELINLSILNFSFTLTKRLRVENSTQSLNYYNSKIFIINLYKLVFIFRYVKKEDK
jgi:hypothetical protein